VQFHTLFGLWIKVAVTEEVRAWTLISSLIQHGLNTCGSIEHKLLAYSDEAGNRFVEILE
jgi:hypothetical protein